jgi:hypothetical protein
MLILSKPVVLVGRISLPLGIQDTLIFRKVMPFNLSSEDEADTISNKTEKQLVGFGLGTTDVKQRMFYIAKKGVFGKPLSVVKVSES